MILELHRQGVGVSAIARQIGLDRKTVRRYIERGLEPPAYGPRPPRTSKVAPFADYLQARLAAFPQLTGQRLLRELRDRGYTGGYTVLTDFLRDVRPPEAPPFEVRFETPSGHGFQCIVQHGTADPVDAVADFEAYDVPLSGGTRSGWPAHSRYPS